MRAKITVRFGFEAHSVEEVHEIGSLLCINPSEKITRFPKYSVAKPIWETRVTDLAHEVSPVFGLLQERLDPELSKIKEIQLRFSIRPYVMISICSDFEHRPFVSFTHDQISWLNLINADLVLDVESMFPEDSQVNQCQSGDGSLIDTIPSSNGS